MQSDHSHHIFPQSLLYESGFDADNYVHRQTVNEIANRAFLTASSNIPLSKTVHQFSRRTHKTDFVGKLGGMSIVEKD